MPFCAYCGAQVAESSSSPCPSCGNPNNGAPRSQPASSSGTKIALIVVAVIVAVPVLLAIVGIVAAIAIPNFLTAQQRAKQRRTMADMRVLAQSAETHATAHATYPESLEAATDGWGHPLRYECLTQDEKPCAGYAIVSAGKDGAFEHESNAEYTQGTTVRFDEDIVYANGAFLRHPEGVTP